MPFGHQAGQPATNAGRSFPPEPLTPDEVAAVIGQCSARSRTGIRNRALLILLYRSGLRISEALALKPSDVDMKRHTARVLHGKGDKATVRGFHPSADDALARWTDTRKGLGLRNGPLFCTLDGGPVSDRYVRNLLHRLADKAGVDKRVHPHGMRHTFADELRAGGMDVGAISKLLGHSSIAVTARYLDHLTNDRAVAALAAIDLPPLGSGQLTRASSAPREDLAPTGSRRRR
jgi:site-specific recombinase XerD